MTDYQIMKVTIAAETWTGDRSLYEVAFMFQIPSNMSYITWPIM